MGPEEARREQAKQQYYGSTTDDMYHRIQGDVSYPKGGHGMLPQYTYIWAQRGLGATNLVGKINMLRRKEGEKKRELIYRNKRMKKKKKRFANDPKTMIEFHLEFDGKYPIVDLKVYAPLMFGCACTTLISTSDYPPPLDSCLLIGNLKIISRIACTKRCRILT